MYVSMCIGLIFLIIILVILIIGGRTRSPWLDSLDKKEHKLFFLYPIVDFLIRKTWLKKKLSRIKLPEGLESLYGNRKAEEIKRIYYCTRISPLIMILIITSIFTLFTFAKESNISGNLDDNSLIRPTYGEGVKKVDLTVNIENYKEDFTLDIGERRYSQSDLDQVFDEAIEYLEESMIGENKSRWEVYEDLIFVQQIPGTSIYVEWFPEDYSILNKNGQIQSNEIPEEGAKTSVTAELTYFEVQERHKFTLLILARELTQEESLRKDIQSEISKNSDKSREKKTIKLPSNLHGYDLYWEESRNYDSPKVLIFGLITVVIVWFFGSKDLEDKQKRRKDQMLTDYPAIVNKFTLLINAGMTSKQAWYRIAEEYSKEVKLSKNKIRFAYEEILYTAYKLKLGVTEHEAYEEFGGRCKLLPYLKFSSLLSQNLKKGNKGLTQVLKQEARESLNERKEMVKRYGEEASTKLLLPMIILLIIVLLIVLIPVFISF